jgi:hypothetical protein
MKNQRKRIVRLGAWFKKTIIPELEWNFEAGNIEFMAPGTQIA